MLRLLPPVCRDCGISADERPLQTYLDFRLCASCLARREREVLVGDRKASVASGGVEEVAELPTRKRGKKTTTPKAKAPANKKTSRPKNGPKR